MALRTKRARLGLLAAVAGAGLMLGLNAGSAMAGNITISSDALTFSSDVSVQVGGAGSTGIVNDPLTSGQVGVATTMTSVGTLSTYCTDLFHYTSYSSNAYTSAVMTTSSDRQLNGSQGTWSVAQLNDVTALLQNGALQTQNATTTASLQIAIWEVEYGTAQANGTFSLSSGNLTFAAPSSLTGQALTDTNNAISGATSDLLAVTGTNGTGQTWLTNSSTQVTMLSDPGSGQNLIYLTASGGGGGNGAAPEPSSVALLGVGLAGLWAARRRKQALARS